MAERDLGGQAGESRARNRAGTGEPEILIDDSNAFGARAEIGRLGGKSVLSFSRLTIVLDLGRARLA